MPVLYAYSEAKPKHRTSRTPVPALVLVGVPVPGPAQNTPLVPVQHGLVCMAAGARRVQQARFGQADLFADAAPRGPGHRGAGIKRITRYHTLPLALLSRPISITVLKTHNPSHNRSLLCNPTK